MHLEVDEQPTAVAAREPVDERFPVLADATHEVRLSRRCRGFRFFLLAMM
jgi:hypothetical protein